MSEGEREEEGEEGLVVVVGVGLDVEGAVVEEEEGGLVEVAREEGGVTGAAVGGEEPIKDAKERGLVRLGNLLDGRGRDSTAESGSHIIRFEFLSIDNEC